MAEGGKKMKKKKGKKAKIGKKKVKEPQATTKETILAYQINVVERKLEDVRYEIRGWEEKSHRHHERNNQLKEERDILLKHLLRSARTSDKSSDKKEAESYEDLIAATQEKYARQHAMEEELSEWRDRVTRMVADIEGVQREADIWKKFRDCDRHGHLTHIKVLKRELEDLQTAFENIATHIHHNFLTGKAEIENHIDETLALQKDMASDTAVAQLDKGDCQEVVDNKWLKKEVEMHRLETSQLQQKVEELERANLEVMSQLLDCKVQGVKVSRNLYLNQFKKFDNLDHTSIMEMDLSCLSPLDVDRERTTEHSRHFLPSRTTAPETDNSAIFSNDGQTTTVDISHGVIERHSGRIVMLEEEDFDDYLQLGPVDLKMLTLEGSAMRIHELDRPSSAEMAAKVHKPDTWPVTHPMLMKIVSPHHT